MNPYLLKRRLERVPIVAEAFCHLLLAKAAVHMLPFAWLVERVGAPPPSRVRELSPHDLRRISWAVETAATRPVYWAVCLPQAIAGHWMLRRRGVASSVCFGVKSEQGAAKLAAHAWLRVQDRIILGQNAMEGFVPLAEFPANISPATPPAMPPEPQSRI